MGLLLGMGNDEKKLSFLGISHFSVHITLLDIAQVRTD